MGKLFWNLAQALKVMGKFHTSSSIIYSLLWEGLSECFFTHSVAADLQDLKISTRVARGEEQEGRGQSDLVSHADVNKINMFHISGREQSMKLMIGKSIEQSMTIDALLVNWHRLASTNRWPIDNHTEVVATYRLALKNLGIPHVPACTYMHSQYAHMFEIWIRSPDCLYAVAWFQKSTTETHFETVF